MIKRFERIEGRYVEMIYGQERLAYSRSANDDLYDLAEWAERGGYPGSEISFYDCTNGKVYTPFAKRRDTIYSEPVYADGGYYFLQGDYAAQNITLYRFMLPDDAEPVTEEVASFDIGEVSLYNLRVTGKPVYVFNQDGSTFNCIYPEKFSFALEPHQTVAFVEDGKVYLEEWIEEGWDEEQDCASEDYKYYTKVIVKDFEGNTLSEEVGFLLPTPDGNYWLA
ncbi:MAG: hypothetical protein IKS10_10015 [Lachnospiraceae bacterium]|nr:hypothetical protein [Lachnospiraceae bacterium]